MALAGRVLVLAILTASPRPADACSTLCVRGSLLPGNGATIPANAPGFLWRPTSSGFHEPSITLLRASDRAPVAFTLDALDATTKQLRPTEPLVVGAQYILEEVDGCEQNKVTFTIAAPAPLPASLGSLGPAPSQREQTMVSVSASCDTSVDAAIARFEVANTEEALPWHDLLVYETIVDGATWKPKASAWDLPAIGASWEGRGRDKIFSKCATNDDFPGAPSGLDEGRHVVQLRARVAGTDVMLATEPQTYELDCERGGCSTNRPATLGFVILVLGLLRAGSGRRSSRSG